MAVTRIARISLTSSDPEALAPFYETLGFVRAGTAGIEGAEYGLPGAQVHCLRLRLGTQVLELAAFTPAGKPYPADTRSCDLWFQHCAIVVADMQTAFAQLSAVARWTAISIGGPQKLPASSGGVTAFKFRDPEGHPLELLEFPPSATPAAWSGAGQGDAQGPFLGIDHTAIAVADTGRSRAFYAGLGFAPSGGSTNTGAEQADLDALPNPVVEVTALAPAPGPAHAPPHLELLAYRQPAGRTAPAPACNDVAATRIVLSGCAVPPGIYRDPDRHLVIVAEGG